MKVKALIDCEGLGYKLKTDEEANLDKFLAEKLIKFGYVKEVEVKKPKGTKVKKWLYHFRKQKNG